MHGSRYPKETDRYILFSRGDEFIISIFPFGMTFDEIVLENFFSLVNILGF